MYPNNPALGSPFGTGNETFGLDPLYKLTSAVFGDMTFQASRRRWIQAAAAAGVAAAAAGGRDSPVDPRATAYRHQSEDSGACIRLSCDHGHPAAEPTIAPFLPRRPTPT